MKYRIREQNELKPSGVEWLGDIPKDWEYHKNKYIFKRISNNVGDNYDNYKVLSLTLNGVIERNMNNMGKMPSSFSIYQIVEKDSLILCLFDIDVTPRIIGYVNTQGIISSAYTNLIVKNLYSKYYYYWFLTLNNQNILLNYTKSLRNTINNENFMSLESLACSFFEQQKIANFLDEKSKIFDEAISKKEQLISKLELAKQSLISEVVTGKLKIVEQNSKLQTIKREKNELKPSGVEWLGDIPKDWKTLQIKHYGKFQSGDFIPADNINEKGKYPVFGGNGLRGFTDNFNLTGKYVLIGRQGALCGNINFTIEKSWVTEHAIVVYNKKNIDVDWLGLVLKIMNLNQYSVASAQPGLSIDNITKVRSILPTLTEQQKISKYLDEKLIHFDNTIEKTKQSIKKLKEAKEALISQAVTGKIEVL
ncbi:restriction endonuclease subunit S [Aliarcobacter cryaerophilus]|uniref:Restriction endonuclease subunit S n=1 Tax=Aliarcobacter cryaerophilus TaxID=28198 RepID=A0A2S9TRU1_9BACT|nr:restriction endonuclease subunit S [Aliarcobacter cryaerophilus]PRN01558.1 restriction endonuclease subunit S [Arcobacter cryaerophilus gv. pseudocryaerophilus]